MTRSAKIHYTADFETTTRAEDCRVWVWGTCEVQNIDNFEYGTTIEGFMKWCEDHSGAIVHFHNLKFDAQFIIHHLFETGYNHTTDPKEKASRTFNTLISDMGLYYSIEVIFQKKGRTVKKITFWDSYKLIPLSVEAIADSLKLPVKKGKIDYKCHDLLPKGAPITPEELEYLKNDVQIMAHALNYFHSQGMSKMTIGSCALDEYRRLIGKNYFKVWYPKPYYDAEVRQSYKGGFTYLNPKFEGKTVKNGLVFDVNSLYPSVMRGADGELLPLGEPLPFKGEYKKDVLYPLYIQMIQCQFELKPGKIPTIQIKGTMDYRGNEYLTSSENRLVTLCLTSVDLELFKDQYEIYNPEYLGGWKFKASEGLFNEYIDKWSNNKIQAKKDKNHGLYLISKLMLNSLYGKFGASTKVKSKIPYFEDDKVKYMISEETSKDGIYIAMASFITAYARNKTIRAAQKIQDDFISGKSKNQFVYADTDSLHIYSPDLEMPEGLDIHPTRLGAWDHEMTFAKGKYLRQKCYMEAEIITEEDYLEGIEKPDKKWAYHKDKNGFYKNKITVAGMPVDCHPYVTFRNFQIGATYKGKKQNKIVQGGTILQETEFTIKAI